MDDIQKPNAEHGGVSMSNLGGVQAATTPVETTASKAEVVGASLQKSNPRPAATKKQTVDMPGKVQAGTEQEKNEKVNTNLVKGAVDGVNESLKTNHTSVRFKYHENLKRVSIKIVDDTTDEVIKEIPPEETLEMVEKMLAQAGLIVDERG